MVVPISGSLMTVPGFGTAGGGGGGKIGEGRGGDGGHARSGKGRVGDGVKGRKIDAACFSGQGRGGAGAAPGACENFHKRYVSPSYSGVRRAGRRVRADGATALAAGSAGDDNVKGNR